MDRKFQDNLDQPDLQVCEVSPVHLARLVRPGHLAQPDRRGLKANKARLDNEANRAYEENRERQAHPVTLHDTCLRAFFFSKCVSYLCKK